MHEIHEALCPACSKSLPDVVEREEMQDGHAHMVRVRPGTFQLTGISMVRPEGVPADATRMLLFELRVRRISQRMHLKCAEELLDVIEDHLGLPRLN